MLREEMILKGLIKPAETSLDKNLHVEGEVNDEWVAKKFLQLKDSANKRGIEFSLSLVDVRSLLKKKVCYYTGIKFDGENKRTIDRKDSSKGYVKGNVVPCTYEVNQIKECLVENAQAYFKGRVHTLKAFVNRLEG